MLYVLPVRPVMDLPPPAISDVDLQRTRADIEQFIRHVPRVDLDRKFSVACADPGVGKISCSLAHRREGIVLTTPTMAR